MARFVLQVQQIGQPSRRVELHDTVVVGREAGVDLRIHDDRLVSRRHFILRVTAVGVEMEVLETTNATTVDDEPVTSGELVPIAVGAKIRVGRTVLTLGSGTSLDTTRSGQSPQKRAKERPSTVMVPYAEVESGIQRSNAWVLVKGTGNRKRRSHRLRLIDTTVGRGDRCTFVLVHPSISEQHAQLRFDGVRWEIRDLGSTAGTWVDGQRLGEAPVQLHRNALVIFGTVPTVFVYHDPVTAADDLRDEDRALKILTARRRLSPEEIEQITNRTHGGLGSYHASILMHETEVEPAEWAEAIAVARRRPGLLGRFGDRLSNWLGGQ